MNTHVRLLHGPIRNLSFGVFRSRGIFAAWASAHRLAVVVVVVVCGVLAGGVGSASAKLAFPFDGQLAPDGGSFGSLEANSVAVDDSNGDTYVADSSSGTVDVVETASGSPLGSLDGSLTPAKSFGGGQVEVAANNGTGKFYVLDSTDNVVDVFEPSGVYECQITGSATPSASECNGVAGSDTPAHGFNRPGGIAVDQATGNVYVVDANNNVLDIFSSAGAYLRQISFSSVPNGIEPSDTRSIAVDDANGDVYVTDSGFFNPPRVYVFNASGEYQTAVTGIGGQPFIGNPVSVAADNASGDVYITAAFHAVTGVFEPSGGYITQFATPSGSEGIAVDQASGRLYVSSNSVVDIYGPGVIVPDVTTGPASNVHVASATLGGVVNPDSIQVTACQFEFGTSTGYGQTAVCSPEPGASAGEVAVSGEATGLQENTTYHYRLTASNAGGSESGEDKTFTTAGPPMIDAEFSSGVTQNSANLQAQIDPKGSDTTYYVQYGSSTAYGGTLPVPDGDAGSGKTDVPARVLVEGLSPSTVYHYRFVVSSSLGTVPGPDHEFTTQNGEVPGLLPDGRAWEMVSPPDKRGFPLEAIGGIGGVDIQAAADGNAITYGIGGPFETEAKGNRSFALSQVLSKRTASGWSSLDVETPHEAIAGFTGQLNGDPLSEYLDFSPDLSVGLVEPPGLTPLSPQATEKTPYLRDANGEYTPLVTAANVPPGTKFGQLRAGGQAALGAASFVGASPDLSHDVLSSSQPLVEGIAETEGRENLFEWFAGSLRLVSVLPGPSGKAVTEEGGSATLGDLAGDYNVRHAVSDDGSRVFWDGADGVGGPLYVRDVVKGETVELDTPEAGAQGGSGKARFETASSDGSKAFFADESRLTPDSTAVPGGESSPASRDLYMCVVGEVAGKLACQLKDLSVDHNPGESAYVVGSTVIGAGEDGRYVYFVANGVLAPGATPGNCEVSGGVPSKELCNLYVYDTVTDEITLVAQLPGDDTSDWGGGGNGLETLTAGVSPDGRYLAFMSERSLTGYDNVDANSGQPDVEVYLYDAGTGRLTCPSCNPSGARPSGVFDSGAFPGLLVDRSTSWEGHWLAGSIPGWTNITQFVSFYRSRYLSDSGRLFFDSADALVPGDSDGTEDVYEYEPGGVGSCTGGAGCVGLISSGTSGEESAFLDASESGNDVFFLTAAQLSRQDLDQTLDVYDARVCSASSPCLTGPPASAPPCATADACRAAPSQQPALFGAPASATFSGAGNPVPGASAPAAKKKVLTVAQKRAAALRKCRAKPRRKRASCEAQARKRYRVVVKAKRSVWSSSKKRNG
jgi:DNA-binding beta-propeller fold protein YncE